MTPPPVLELASRGTSHLTEAQRLTRRGAVGAALAATEGAADASTDPAVLAALDATRLECRLARGELAAAHALREDLRAHLASGGAAAALAHLALGELASAAGEPDLALDHFLLVADDDLPWRSGAALALVRLGRRREAREHALQHHADALAHGTAYDVALALRTLATVDGTGDPVRRLREALALSAEAERLRAQVVTDLAGLLLMLPGDTTHLEALALLREAEDYARREGLWPLSGRVRRLLERVGATPRHHEAEVLAGLTPAERRVTLLVLGGSTNRQVADQLLVSIKAVEGHLSKVYRKLGVTSRAALTASLRAGVVA